MVDSQDLLQHPRRNLGNRYRSSAQKFASLAQKDPERARENFAWAEQNARQAILHDFTDERNWRCLAELKVSNKDGDGLHAVMEDVFSILGRDPEHLDQLKGIDFLAVGRELLEAAFSRDPLDPRLLVVVDYGIVKRTKRNRHPIPLHYQNFLNDASALISETNVQTLYSAEDWNGFAPLGMKIYSLNSPDIYSLTDQTITSCGWKWEDCTNGGKKSMMPGPVTTTCNNCDLTWT